MNPIRTLRLESGMTQEMLAYIMRVSVRTVQRWEVQPTVSFRILLAVSAATGHIIGKEKVP